MNTFKSLLLTALLIGFTCLLIAQENSKTITMTDIWSSGKFYPKMVRGLNPMNDGATYAMLEDSMLNVYDYKNGEKVQTLLNTKKLIPDGTNSPLPFGSYEMSPDESMILIPAETESIYRHSTKSNYYIYELESGRLYPLSTNGKQQLAEFSPDSKQIAFVRDNNLFVVSLESREEKQLTTDGEFNAIINGTTDWVYEEEFSFTKAFFWSPDSKTIAFYRFDESHVKLYQMELFTGLYPEWYTYKYPKAGEDNSIVTIHTVSTETGKLQKIDTGSETDLYFPRIKWSTSPDKLAIYRLNRLQNKLEILLANTQSGSISTLYEEENQWYIDIENNLNFLPDGKHFVISSEKDGFNHLYLYGMDGKLIRQLTSGPHDITAVYGFDSKNQTIYFQQAVSSPMDRQIAAVNLKGKTQLIIDSEGSSDASFSKDFSYFIHTFSTANEPPVFSLRNNKGKLIRTLEDNQELKSRLATYNFSPKTFFSFEHPDVVLPDGKTTHLNGWQILPANFDPNKQYPVLLFVYGGPGIQTVRNSWGWNDYFWHQLLSQKGFVVVSVDNRGTGARGETFKKMTYKELGKYETEDMISTAKYLSSLPYIDGDRIGIYGWSYGGFMATSAITLGADYFNTAVAVAPVTSWRYYDNIYTERYMQKPQENPKGYDNNSPINHVDKLKGNYLLIHGSADDNVHYQNTMELIEALVRADKQFDLMIYPNKNHGIYGGNTRKHVFDKITNFLIGNLKPNE
ncbi:MAG: S9 family peptidase [Bacteroidales bacterium]|nr:S9 family peptidase [Bacteroidales bacterium]HOI32006.1 S9 family peptidase [Bacteroidales bacterium]